MKRLRSSHASGLSVKFGVAKESNFELVSSSGDGVLLRMRGESVVKLRNSSTTVSKSTVGSTSASITSFLG